MNNNNSFRRIAAFSAILSAPLALGASIILAMAIDFNVEIMSNPVGLITLGDRVATVFRWVQFTALFGYYLLLIPATIYLWNWLRPQNPNLVNMSTIFGLSSILIGGIGLTLLFSVLPPMISAYPQASEAQRYVLVAVFQAVTDEALVGLLPLSSILGGLWLLGIGLILRAERRALGITAVALGIVTLVYGVGENLRVELLASLEPLTFFSPIWALWLGIVIWRGTEKSEPVIEPGTDTLYDFTTQSKS